MQTKNNRLLADIQPIAINNKVSSTLNGEDFLDAMRYCYNDILSVEKYASYNELRVDIPNMIDRVIFNNPATIILWKDGSKTVVKKTEDDVWDPEKGFCMAVIKKLYGHTSFIKDYIEQEEMPILTVEEACNNLKNLGKTFRDILPKGGK